MKALEKSDFLKPPRVGEIIEGRVIDKGRSSVFLDLGPIGTGIIYGREFLEAKDKLKGLKVNDKLFGKIVELDNEEGYIEMSVSGATKELAFDVLRQKKESEEIFPVKIMGANKGGLITKISGIQAFLPVSQLSSENYPKVEGGEKTKILKELQKFIGRELEVKIIDLSQREGQIILSEKAKELDKKKEYLKKYKIGDEVEGKISGITNFGAFFRFDEGLEGLIHISELDWKIIKDPSEVVKPGDKVKAKIIDISNGKVSLSLKQNKGA